MRSFIAKRALELTAYEVSPVITHRVARLRAASQGTTRRWVGLQALQAHSTGTWTPPDKPSGPRTNGSEHDEWTSADSSHGGRGWES